MDNQIKEALTRGHLIDITTIGRKTGQAHRKEIAFHNINGRIYISGLPGPRGWYANLLSNPSFTFHLKGRVSADLPARAIPIKDPAQRRAILTEVVRIWNREGQLEAFIEESPLVEVEMQGFEAAA